MYTRGIVTLAEREVGVFIVDEEDKISITFAKGAAGVEETLEYAAEQGLTLSLQLKPEYESAD